MDRVGKITRITRISLAILLSSASLAQPARAAAKDPDRVTALESKLNQSLQLIAQLSARVQELESQAHTLAPAAPVDNANKRLDTVEREVAQIATAHANSRTEDTGAALHGFADVGTGNHNALDETRKGASIGSLDFFLTPQLGSRTRGLFELNFEVGDGGEIGVDLERAQLGYQFTDAAMAWLGRFHTPYGYYNTAVHHGQQLSISLRRPKFLQFEDQGGVLPAHTVGGWLTGARHFGNHKLTYDLYVGNAQGITDGTIDMKNGGTAHGNVIVGGGLGLHLGGALDGLKVGGQVLGTRVEDDLQNITRLNVYGVYVAFDTDRWENIAEFYLFNNEDLSGGTGTHESQAGFAQLAYRVGLYTPYLRYERAALQQTDHFFSALHAGGSYYRDALGLRFDIDLKSALKFELAQTYFTDRAPRNYSDVLVQYAIRF